ncbi:hypothetical protein VP01_1167g1 [Puccinia sorghi]|uniref:Uncharacterized protein n=1 Tax=Puccinia sorghi TaxID=27349 RepID=A0A0L6VRC6_9BASI|nr:hypothetical protein VP01_1167g1 [Puccinia sorghi]
MSDQRDPYQDQSALNARSYSRHPHVSQPNLRSHSAQHGLGKASTHPEVEALFDCVLGNKGKSVDRNNGQDKSLANTIIINPPTPVPPTPLKSTSTSTKFTPLPTNNGSTVDKELFKKFLLFTKMTQALAPATPSSKPTLRELSLVLYKWLPNVPKLNVNRDNFQTWVVMVHVVIEIIDC